MADFIIEHYVLYVIVCDVPFHAGVVFTAASRKHVSNASHHGVLTAAIGHREFSASL